MANLTLCTFLICFVLFISIEAGRIQPKPVYERNSDNADFRGNPLVAESKNELTQRARAHIQNQQRRYNMEKTRKHKALMEHAQSRGSETMDSYLKAYQEQQDNYQRDVERKVSLDQERASTDRSKSLKDYPNSQWWKNGGQTRHKRVNTDSGDHFKPISAKRAISHMEVRNTPYILSPSYYYAPAESQNLYSYSPSQTYKAEEEKSSLHHVQPYEQLTHYKSNGDIQSLSALLGKEPNDQLRGFNELLNNNNNQAQLSPSFYDNVHVNLKASSLDGPSDGQATQYVFQNSYQADEAAQQQYAYSYKDHTPITENVNDVADTRSPVSLPATVKYVYPTESPLGHTLSTNYYKVEVANQVVTEPKSEVKYYNLDESDQHNSDLHYASQYEFGYRVRDPHSGNDFGHQEVSDGKTAKGNYHVLLPDGRLQKVSYVAGPSGYHANVSYQKI